MRFYCLPSRWWFFFASSIADANQRYQEAPFRALMGNERFEALIEGKGGFPHYLGADLGAPNFTLKDRYGKDWTLADHRGRVVVLNFWSVTCKPCLQEMPTIETLNQVAQQWGDVDVVTVSTDAGWPAVQAMMNPNTRLTYLFDPDRSVVEKMFGTKLYPETWIIDKNGVIRVRYDGGLDWANPVALDMIAAYR